MLYVWPTSTTIWIYHNITDYPPQTRTQLVQSSLCGAPNILAHGRGLEVGGHTVPYGFRVGYHPEGGGIFKTELFIGAFSRIQKP